MSFINIALLSYFHTYDITEQIYIEAYYYEERYSPGPLPDYSKEEVDMAVKKAEDLITKVREEMEKDLE